MDTKNESKIKSWVGFFLPMLISAAVAGFIFRCILCMAYIPSGSMMDTIPEGSMVVALRTHYDWPIFKSKPLERGDIVIFDAEGHEAIEGGPHDAKYYAKRVAGLPGETIEVINGMTYINGKIYDESEFLRETPEPMNFGPYAIPEDSYFMMGDNRNNSVDSRYWSDPFVSKYEITGKVFYIFAGK